MNHFATISSPDYLPFVRTLLFSLRGQDPEVILHVLVLGASKPAEEPSLLFYTPDELKEEQSAEIIRKYAHEKDKLRWALKPVFMMHLLDTTGKLIYLDNDIYFYKPYRFLFQLLDHHPILLTPHWFPLEPYPNPDHFKTTFQIGLYNAGFIGASTGGRSALEWWARLCLFAMERNIGEGLFDDQRYLDALPLVEERTGIVRHRGCNVGSWNVHWNKRMKVGNEVTIEGSDPLVFIHFNSETIRHITNGNDHLLAPYLDKYRKAFALTGQHLENFKPEAAEGSSWLKQIRRKTKFRTRLKAWLFQLSQKL